MEKLLVEQTKSIYTVKTGAKIAMDYSEEISKILKKLPHKLQVKFALKCAKEVKYLLNDPDSLKALEITELWLEDKVTTEEVRKAAYAAPYAIYATSDASAAYAAPYAAYAAVAYAADAYSPTNAVFYSSKALKVSLKHYYTKLLDSLTDLEKEVYGL